MPAADSAARSPSSSRASPRRWGATRSAPCTAPAPASSSRATWVVSTAPGRRGRRERRRARHDDAAGAAGARGLGAASVVYGGDKALGERLDKALADTRLTTTLQASRRHIIKTRVEVEGRNPDWAARVDRARAIRSDAVARAPELLDRFERAVTANGGSVIRAADGEAAVRAVLEIARRAARS